MIKHYNQSFQAHYTFSILDKVHIGITATNKGWLDNGIEWFDHALSNIKPEDAKESIKKAKSSLKDAKITHDHLLDKRGPVSEEHRTFSVPFDSKLRKKKKYKKMKQKKVKKHQALVPMFHVPEFLYKEQVKV